MGVSFVSVVLGMDSRVWIMTVRHSTVDLHPHSITLKCLKLYVESHTSGVPVLITVDSEVPAFFFFFFLELQLKQKDTLFCMCGLLLLFKAYVIVRKHKATPLKESI